MFKFNKNNIKRWAKKYEEGYGAEGKSNEKRLKNIFKSKKYLTQNNFYDVLNWKSPRIRNYAMKNAPARIVKITRNSFAMKDERSRIESLLGQRGGLKGVGYPVASTILHFAFPDRYPIMDFRVIRSLGIRQPSSYKFDFWGNYCRTISGLSKKYGLSIREVEKALWKYDKEQNSHLNKCERWD